MKSIDIRALIRIVGISRDTRAVSAEIERKPRILFGKYCIVVCYAELCKVGDDYLLAHALCGYAARHSVGVGHRTKIGLIEHNTALDNDLSAVRLVCDPAVLGTETERLGLRINACGNVHRSLTVAASALCAYGITCCGYRGKRRFLCSRRLVVAARRDPDLDRCVLCVIRCKHCARQGEHYRRHRRRCKSCSCSDTLHLAPRICINYPT